MELPDYKSTYEKALAELSQLMDRREQLDIERDELDTRISQVRRGVEALVPLCGENPYATHPDLFQSELGALMPDMGLTDAVRKVVSSVAPTWVTPVGVRTGLRVLGYEIKAKNILPSLHTILKRLEDKKEVVTKDIEGRTWYRWNLPTAKKPRPKWTEHVDWSKIAEEIGKKS